MSKCEICQSEPAEVLSNMDRWDSNHWVYVGRCEIDKRAKYQIGLNELIGRETEWVAHLREKKWFDESAFIDAMRRRTA